MMTTSVDLLGGAAPASPARGQNSKPPGLQAAAENAPSDAQPLVVPEDLVLMSPQAEASAPPAPAPEETPKEDLQEATLKRIQEVVGEAEKRATAVRFEVDSDNGEVIVRIVNKESGDVIRQMPPDEIRNLRQNLHDLRGVLFEDVS